MNIVEHLAAKIADISAAGLVETKDRDKSNVTIHLQVHTDTNLNEW